ncbi:hypothetical protein [Sphingomonas sp. S-NIH.Pt15_0812]|uniref:hypothetical protein n=1 Tax=Sphingomonas sp. S-NIH.Pt15_0812 TaxID=1920129 RepID=UPI000F7F4279|nr:hypothetical protein [Sphingomonas sp. S-NIH.Pt15_0812]
MFEIYPVKMIIRFYVILLGVIVAAAPTCAAEVAGIWALRAQGSTLMLFEVSRSRDGWTGSWTQPSGYDTNGEYFNDIKAGTTVRRSREVHNIKDGIELVFDNPWPGGAPDHITVRVDDTGHASMHWAAFNSTRYQLTRVASRTELGPWQPDRGYIPDMVRSTSDAMTAIFNADQADRLDPAHIEWKIVSAADRSRRKQAQALLDSGQLSSGDDFYHAAFVFQHGDEPDDFMRAHALAMIAIARGRPDATWIGAATLDRYLQYSGRPQVYGTQFTRPATNFTQEPYQRGLLSDAIRKASNVPPLAVQEKQRAAWDRRMPLGKTP